MRKLTTSALTVTLLMSLAVPAHVSAAQTPDEQRESSHVRKQAIIVSVDEEERQVTARGVQDDRSIILNLTDETFVVDAVNGLNTTVSERVNDMVHVYHGSAITRSEPPMANAYALILNVPEDYTPPHFHIAEAVAVYNDSVRVSVDNGGLIITLGEDTGVTTSLYTSYGESTEISAVREDSRLLLWYEAVAASHPAQATASRAVLLKHGAAATPERGLYDEAGYYETNQYDPTNDQGPYQTVKYTFPLSEAVMLENGPWVPLRQVGEALGFNITWNEEEKSVTIVTHEGTAYVAISQNGRLVGNRTFVCTDFFRRYSGEVVQQSYELLFY